MARALLCFLLLALGAAVSSSAKLPAEADQPFSDNYAVLWAPDHTKLLDNGRQLQLVLDNSSGAGFGSKGKYMFGRFTMRMKLVPGDSAGTVTAFYMSSESANHDELDFEFLGNRSGQPYTVQTNVFANGKGEREQRISLWFDPTTDFHDYSFLWNEKQITFYVDDVAIRVFRNIPSSKVDYPNTQPMGIFSSLWNGDQWATRGGLEKIRWDQAPFPANYRGFIIDGCTGTAASCTKRSESQWWNQAAYQTSDAGTESDLQRIKSSFLIYDYCTDTKRYPTPPTECAFNS